MHPLFEAIKAGDLPQVTALIEADPSLLNATGENGQSALVTAKYLRNEEIVRTLEEHGATLDIFAAAMLGRTELIEELVGGNRSLASALSRDGWTPLHLAAFFGELEAARVLLNHGAVVNASSTNAMRNTPLHAAAAGRSSEIAKLLLDRGASPNARQHGGWTPLHAAAQNGDLEMARTLITAGADLEIRADNNQLPLDMALLKGHQTMVEFLEMNGARL